MAPARPAAAAPAVRAGAQHQVSIRQPPMQAGHAGQHACCVLARRAHLALELGVLVDDQGRQVRHGARVHDGLRGGKGGGQVCACAHVPCRTDASLHSKGAAAVSHAVPCAARTCASSGVCFAMSDSEEAAMRFRLSSGSCTHSTSSGTAPASTTWRARVGNVHARVRTGVRSAVCCMRAACRAALARLQACIGRAPVVTALHCAQQCSPGSMRLPPSPQGRTPPGMSPASPGCQSRSRPAPAPASAWPRHAGRTRQPACRTDSAR